MPLQYNLHIEDTSTWFLTTPSVQTKKLPVYVLECGEFYALDNYYTSRSHVDVYTLLLTIDGAGEIDIDGTIYKIAKNHLFLLNGNKNVSYHTLHAPWHFQWVQFSGSSAISYDSLIQPYQPLLIHEHHEVATYMKQFFQYIQKDDIATQLMSSALLVKLLSIVAIETCNTTSTSYHRNDIRVQDWCQFIQEHFQESLSIDQLADNASVSKYHYIHTFKKVMGIAPYEYITNLRISHAKRLLKTTDFALEEISHMCGFHNAKILIRNFQKITGMNPSTYRKS